MEYKIELKFKNPENGGFFIIENGVQLAELEFHLEGKNLLNAYHTGVRKELEGQGIAGKLFDALVKYARENHSKIIATCPYVLAKFNRHPEEFADIWQRAEDEPTGESCGIKPK